MIEFKEIFHGGIHEHCMFMKKNKLAHKTIFLNIVNFYCIM